MIDPVLKFFAAVIQQKQEVIQKITTGNPQLYFVEGKLIFSLSGLYECVADSGDESYTEFRSKLYSGTLNSDLAKLGFSVVIYKSTQKIDTSFYQLVEIKQKS